MNANILNIDITKTIIDLAGVVAPNNYQGMSLVPFLKNQVAFVNTRG